jgi:hypothetical protein
MKKYKVEIEGVSPLLMNRFVSGTDLEPTKKRVVTTPKVDIKDKLYTLPDGKIYIPARYIERALIEAGKSFKGRGKSSLSAIIGAMLSVEPEALVLTNQEWVEDIQTGVNPMTKGRTNIHRPRFDKWGAKFEMVISTDDIPTERLKEILDYAGLYVGLGDWRPAKKGKYGKFIVKKFEEVKE